MEVELCIFLVLAVGGLKICQSLVLHKETLVSWR